MQDEALVHPERGELERFMRGELGASERRRVVRHLLAGCESCSQVTRRIWALADGQAGRSDQDLAERYRRLSVRDPALPLRVHLAPVGASEDATEKEASLRAARSESLAAGHGLAAAQASLNLAVLYGRQERWADVRGLAAEIFPLLSTRDLGQGSMAALLVFRRAVETESAPVEFLTAVAEYLAETPSGPGNRL